MNEVAASSASSGPFQHQLAWDLLLLMVMVQCAG